MDLDEENLDYEEILKAMCEYVKKYECYDDVCDIFDHLMEDFCEYYLENYKDGVNK